MLIDLDEARRYVLDGLTPLSEVQVSLDEASQCAIAHDVVARESVPRFENSAMDGYALRSVDTRPGGAKFRVVGKVLAGQVATRAIEKGEAVRIMTGAPMPTGADAVCKIEEVIIDGAGHVMIPRAVDVHEYVRHIAEDVRVGQVLVRARREITPAVHAVLSSQGYSSVRVHRRPKIAVLSTGDELCSSEILPEAGQIRDINRPLLLALLREAGCVGVDLGIVADDYEEIVRSVAEAAGRYDAVVTSGGVSVGDVDYVKTALLELGRGRARSMQIAIKPARPFAFGRVGSTNTPVFSLPGNPVAAQVSFELLVRPALRTLGGHRPIERLETRSILDVSLTAPSDERTHFVHMAATLSSDGRIHLRRVSEQGSHQVSALVNANALAILRPGRIYDVGGEVRTMVLDPSLLARPFDDVFDEIASP